MQVAQPITSTSEKETDSAANQWVGKRHLVLHLQMPHVKQKDVTSVPKGRQTILNNILNDKWTEQPTVSPSRAVGRRVLPWSPTLRTVMRPAQDSKARDGANIAHDHVCRSIATSQTSRPRLLTKDRDRAWSRTDGSDSKSNMEGVHSVPARKYVQPTWHNNSMSPGLIKTGSENTKMSY